MYLIICPGCNGPYLSYVHRWWICPDCRWEKRDPDQRWATGMYLREQEEWLYADDVPAHLLRVHKM